MVMASLSWGPTQVSTSRTRSPQIIRVRDFLASQSISNQGVVDHFTANGNNIGIFIADGHGPYTFVTIADSVITNNASIGLSVGQAAPSHATAYLTGSVVTGNGIGVDINASFTGTVFTYGDNEINNNVTDIVGTLTPVAKR